MKRTGLVVVSLLLALASVAGNKLQLKQITDGTFRAASMAAVRTMPDGETYTQLSDDGRRIVQYSFKTGKEVAVLFDVATAKGSQLDAIDDYMLSPDGSRLLVQTNTQRIYRHSLTATYYIYTIRNNRLVPLSDHGPQQTPLFSPDGLQIAFVRDNNIFIVKLLYDNAEVQITKDGKRNEIINGIPDWVNEEEFSNDRAMVFTADSKQLVWVRYDESKVPQYSMQLFKGLAPERTEYADYPGFYTYKYPIAGQQNAQATLWSFDIASRQTRQLQLPVDADGYVPRLVMTSDATQVAAYTLNRHQDCLRIFMCNPLSTVCRQVVEEQVDKYVREEAMEGIVITDQHILVPSDRSGWMHLYLYNHHGQLLRQVDTGDYEVSTVYGYDEATGDTYFASHESGATEQRVYVVHANGKKECLTPKAGWNTAVFSHNYKYFIRTWSDLNTPPEYALCDNKGKVLTTLIDNRQLVTTLSTYDLGQRELMQLTTAEGVVLNAWVVKPAGFNASRRYPVVMYQYGGPGSQQVKNVWNIGMAGQGAILEQLLCQQGFVCVCVDNRGTGGRGADFEKCIYQKLGQLEAADQVEAALWLGRQPWVDKERIAIWGWSFGGFNTLMSMSEGREVFRAGIAIAPPTSWKFYDTVYTERFMRTPKENPMGYFDNPIHRAEKLHGALLLCHGLADDNVHFRNTAEYTEALVQADKDFSQLVYTNRNHGIYGGNTRQHLYRQCLQFFERELK
ncbi:MAG: S9 family peptidase [Prevotella sp.]|nr:S9 family peptidase [Prevotella sp.]